LDRAPAGMVAALERTVKQIPGVLNCRQLRLRQSGNRMFVDLVIDVRRGASVESSHAIGEAAEEGIRAVLPNADVVVHVEPVCGGDETLTERIRAVAANEGQTVHNIRVYSEREAPASASPGPGALAGAARSEEGGRLHVELHVEADENLDLRQAHERADRLEAAIRAELPSVARITTHIEPHRERREPLQDVSGSSEDLVRRVRALVAGTAGIVECHEVTVRRTGRDVFLTMHCTFAAGLSIRDVHEISTGLEERLRGAIPDLVRVTTHPEPSAEGPG
jgi:divalent metal cation (Fe/Co/Zn/Cd) transporter